MTLPTMPKKVPRPKALTVRLSEVAVNRLKTMSAKHNLSQADVVEHLIHAEYEKTMYDDLKPLATKKRNK